MKNIDDSHYDELYTNSSYRSACCGSPPWGEVDEDMCGICSGCKDHATFEIDNDE